MTSSQLNLIYHLIVEIYLKFFVLIGELVPVGDNIFDAHFDDELWDVAILCVCGSVATISHLWSNKMD